MAHDTSASPQYRPGFNAYIGLISSALSGARFLSCRVLPVKPKYADGARILYRHG